MLPFTFVRGEDMFFIKDCAIFFLGVVVACCIGYAALCYLEEIPKFISKKLKK